MRRDLQASLGMWFCPHVLLFPSCEKPKATSGRAREPKPGTPHPSKGKKISSQKASPGTVSKTNPEPWLTTQKRESSQRFSFRVSRGGSQVVLQPG